MTPDVALPTGPALANAIATRALYRWEAYRELGTLYVSNSTLSAVRECDTRGLLAAMGYTSQTENIKMRLGSDAHEAVAEWRQGRGIEAALATFTIRYREWSEMALAQLDAPFAERMVPLYGYENAYRVLTVYLRDHAPTYPFTFHPELVEVPFALPLDTTCARCGVDECDHVELGSRGCGGYRPAIIACGKIDALVEGQSGEWYVDDLKTTGQLDASWARKFFNDSQFSHYTWGASAHLGKPIAGGVVSALEWSRMPEVKLTAKGTPWKCRTHGVGVDECGDLHVNCRVIGPILRSERMIADWHRDALGIARHLKAMLDACDSPLDLPRVAGKQGAFTYQCPKCFANEWCSGDRVTAYMESMLQQHPWEGLPRA